MKKNKFLIFILLVIFLISVFSVSCFAYNFGYSFDAGSVIILNSVLDTTTFSSYSVDFSSNGRSFSSIFFEFRGNDRALLYDSLVVYSNGSWVDDSYRYIHLDSSLVLSGDYAFVVFLTHNVSSVLLPSEPDPVGFFDVLTSVSDWVSSTLSSTDSLFFVDGHFTLFGGLLVLGLSFGLVLLLVYLLFNFVRLL